MKKRIRLFTLLACMVLLVSAISLQAFAAPTSTVSGGWSETEGYYTNEASETGGWSIYASSRPDYHFGEKLRKTVTGGDPTYAAHGVTLWEDMYHYTTAQMEGNDGSVKTTSGRKWGIDETEATSPYYSPPAWENVDAKTYWGNNNS